MNLLGQSRVPGEFIIGSSTHSLLSVSPVGWLVGDTCEKETFDVPRIILHEWKAREVIDGETEL